MIIEFENTVQADDIQERLMPLKQLIEKKINLSEYPEYTKSATITNNALMRICLFVGLSQDVDRVNEKPEPMTFKRSQRFVPTFFTVMGFKALFSALIKIKYQDCNIDFSSSGAVGRIVNQEIFRGIEILKNEQTLDEWLNSQTYFGGKNRAGSIPILDLLIGTYEDDIEAKLDVNSRKISNTQILIAGTTGSGKSNLLAVLIHQLRTLSIDSAYPVNFLLFDYKGEFSDPANSSWLGLFETNEDAILRPMEKPLPFTPFRDFTGATTNELYLYAQSMSLALSSIDATRASATMNNRLTEAIIDAYNTNRLKPITFKKMLDAYIAKLPDNKKDADDTITSVLKQLVRANLFAESDSINLVKDCYIIDLGKFEKNGPIAKAIVYFVVAKLNNIYDNLPKQAVNDESVEIRHFTIIDEAHYMLGFKNKPLETLIAVGRNKGMSIILATQNMDSFKNDNYDYTANAQYPLIMKQQSINDGFIKTFFGVNGKEFQELREAISGLKKGELIIKNDITEDLLGIAVKKWKKIKVTHLI